MVEQENALISPNSSAGNQTLLSWIIIDSPSSYNENSPVESKSGKSGMKNMIQKEETPCFEQLFENYCPEEKNLMNEFDDWKPQFEPETVPSTSNPFFEHDQNFYWDVSQYPFQVDVNDLIQGPTLAELNANDESALDLFDIFPDHSPTNKSFISVIKNQIDSTQCTVSQSEDVCLKKSATITKESELNNNSSNEKLLDESIASVKIPLTQTKCFSSCVNTKRRGTLSDSEESSDNDYSSETGEESDYLSERNCSISTTCKILQQKKKKFFWQYNLQSKGPKHFSTRMTGKSDLHEVIGVADPVKNVGKLRKGDGNDFSPNPKKLYNIGLELEKLNDDINNMIPANELPISARSRSRKEKNKLASRACRLKKKAQHEANKIKLFGLQREQKHLLKCVNEVKKVVLKKIEKPKKYASTSTTVESVIKKKAVSKIAGCTTEFVNKVINSVASGDENGGLRDM